MKMNALTTTTLVAALTSIASTTAFNPNFTLFAASASIEVSTLGGVSTYDVCLQAEVNNKLITIAFENTEDDESIDSYTSFYYASDEGVFGEKLSFDTDASTHTVIELANKAGGEEETLLNDDDISLAVEQLAILRNALTQVAA